MHEKCKITFYFFLINVVFQSRLFLMCFVSKYNEILCFILLIEIELVFFLSLKQTCANTRSSKKMDFGIPGLNITGIREQVLRRYTWVPICPSLVSKLHCSYFLFVQLIRPKNYREI